MATRKEPEIPGLGGMVIRHLDEGTVVDRYVILREKNMGEEKKRRGRRQKTGYYVRDCLVIRLTFSA